MTRPDSIVTMAGVELAFGGLRPLRISQLTLDASQRIAITGLDASAAEAFVNLVTGARLPNRGIVTLFGQPTAEILRPEDWLKSLDRVGIVSARAVLLDELTVFQNIAMALTLSIDQVPDAVAADVRSLAAEVGLASEALDRRVSNISAFEAALCHLARALAPNPLLLLLEHANALAGVGALEFGAAAGRVADSRRLATLSLTADEDFARRVAARVLRLDPATGALADRAGWRRWVRIGRS